MRFLLDTNIVSNVVLRPQGSIAENIREVGEAPGMHERSRGGGIAVWRCDEGVAAPYGSA